MPGARGHTAALAAWLSAPVACRAGGVAPAGLVAKLLEDSKITVNHPGYTAGIATTIHVGMRIAHLHTIDPQEGTYKVAGILQLQWYDPRLDFSTFNIGGFDRIQWSSDEIWNPLVYLRDAVVDDSGSETEVVTSDSHGLVKVQRLLHMSLMCSTMSFEEYPFDGQSCSMTFVPLRGGADMIQLSFLDTGIAVATGIEEYSTGEWMQFEISHTTGVEDIWDFNEFVSWSYAKATFSMKRIPAGRLYNMVLPSILMTIMSYSGYWINPAAAPARVTLAMVAVLATVAHRGSVMHQLPAVSYMIWIDSYILMNLGFNFIAVICYAAVNFGMQCHTAEAMAEDAARKKSDDGLGATDGGDDKPGIDKEDPDVAEEQHRSRPRRKTCHCRLRLSDLRHADRVMRVLVPIAYAIANVLMAMYLI